MPADTQSREFDLHVLAQLEELFEKDALETFVAPPRFSTDGDLSIIPDFAVRVKLTSGIQAECSRFNSQIQNKICCLIEILQEINRL